MNYNAIPIRLKPDERVMLKKLARHLERSQADTVRVLVRGAFQMIMEEQQKTLSLKQQQAAQPEPA